jgi:branched-subunit amino acid aminotransferase/4-amino-4-deoxychorismate lyase
VKNGKIFSPKKNCYFGNTLKYISKKIKINFKDISIKTINDYDEIILIGSGKGVTSVKNIPEIHWKRKSIKVYKKFKNIYKKAISSERII